MKFKANFLYKPSNFQMDDCQIERVVEARSAPMETEQAMGPVMG